MRPTAFPPDFHMVNLLRTRGQENSSTQNPQQAFHQGLSFRAALPRGICFWGAQQHATILPSASNHKDADESAHAEAEDRKLRKDP
jgi:hypothetical protein